MAASDDKPSALPTFVLIDDEDLEHLPTPEWLWDGVLVRGGTAVMFGESGIGKTFEALEIGLSVQTGQPSQGRATLQGAVVYVPGEGLAGMKARVGAWKCSRDFKGRAGIHFTKRTVNLLDEADVKAFCDSIAPLKPVLVIIDTLARAMVGGDEDGSKDMGVVIDTIVRMAAFLNATVLLLHHPVKKKPFVERGSSALRGGVDTLLSLRKKDGRLVLKCEKQKDAEPFDDIALTLRIIDLGDGRSSCVIESADKPPEQSTLNDREIVALLSLWQRPDHAAGYVEWLNAGHGIPESSFVRITKTLVKGDHVTKGDGPKAYRLTEKGIGVISAATANSLPTHCHGSDSRATATTATPSIEGAGGSGSGSKRVDLGHLSDEPIER